MHSNLQYMKPSMHGNIYIYIYIYIFYDGATEELENLSCTKLHTYTEFTFIRNNDYLLLAKKKCVRIQEIAMQ